MKSLLRSQHLPLTATALVLLVLFTTASLLYEGFFSLQVITNLFGDNAFLGIAAVGTLACPQCDAPVSPGDRPLRPMEPVACPYCGHAGVVRDFLSLATPARPAYVEIRLRG